jgi:hypothetical protein
MATDQSPPRIKLILTIAVSAVVSLGVIKLVLDSYFISMSEDAAHEKLAQPVELEKLREGEQKNLTSSPTPITAAMMEIGKGRNAQGGPDLITPLPSDDIGPLTGWGRLPRQFELPPGAAGDGGATTTMTAGGDGGAGGAAPAMLSTDAGAAPALASKDGGAPRHR